jgi:hypothetical protein
MMFHFVLADNRSPGSTDAMRILICAVAACSLTLTGCGLGEWAHDVGGRVNPDSLSLADRCANVLKAAIPSAEMDIKSRTSQNGGIDIMTAQVTATRTDHPDDTGIARDLSAECKFDNTVLVDFHWTSGAPKH